MPIRSSFSGERLRRLRNEGQLSRHALAWAVGRTVDSIGNYERGITTPSAEIVAKLADILECDVQDLFEAVEHA